MLRNLIHNRLKPHRWQPPTETPTTHTAKILSFNINGIMQFFRVLGAKTELADVPRRMLLEAFLDATGADVVCFQEIKRTKKFDAGVFSLGSFPTDPTKVAWYGVATYARKGYTTEWVENLGDEPNEGRVITTIHPGFTLVNVYCVNGTSSAARCKYKAHFHCILTQHCATLKRQFGTIVVAGDFNIAHERLDVWHPTRYNHLSTCLPHEREWFCDFLANTDLVDTYRNRWIRRKFTWFERWKGLPPNPEIGLRIDYIVTNSSTLLVSADIHDDLLELSDHCPISAEVVVDNARPISVHPLDAPSPQHVTSFSNAHDSS
ncbi:hypothetical protein HK102_005418 [Quaeritorhiza haematococci]|nr:hypothetical protein HK102_005418 [Quaeritorhiza haematococci]